MILQSLYKFLEDKPKYRQTQIWHLIYKDLIDDWDQASVLPLAWRKELNKVCPLTIIAEESRLADNSIKATIELVDKVKIETVLIKNSDGRHTICLSSQVGCPLGCKFCATGQGGFTRNLTVAEIVDQVLYFARLLNNSDDKIDNVVFMGMGEPLLNTNNVLEAIRVLNDPDKFGLGSRRISISTVGLKPGIDKIISSGLQVNLALSLHAVTDRMRLELMPVHKKTSIRELMSIIDNYIEKTNRKVMIEYLLLSKVNDSKEDAEALAKLLADKLVMVNLIQYNDTGAFKMTDPAKAKTFANVLERHGIKATIRSSHGQGINAACGQLAVNN